MQKLDRNSDELKQLMEKFQAHQDSVDAHILLVREAINAGNFPLARSVFLTHFDRLYNKKLLSEKLLQAAKLASKLGLSDRCQMLLLIILQEDKKNPAAVRLLVSMMVKSKNFVSAFEYINKYILIFPSSVFLWKFLVEISPHCVSKKDIDLIIDRAIKVTGSNPSILNAALKVYKRSGGVDKEGELLALIEEKFVQEYWALKVLFKSKLELGDFAAASILLKKIGSGEIEEKSALNILASRYYDAIWDLDSAVAMVEAALSFSPRKKDILQYAARLFIKSMRPLEARRLLQEANLRSYGTLKMRGKSLNASQSLTGEMMNEFLINEGALEASRIALEGGEALSMAAVVRDFPSSTCSAVALLIGFRKMGAFAQEKNRSNSFVSSEIPLQLVQYWDSAEVPSDVLDVCATWRDRNPEFAYTLFNDASARRFILDRDDRVSLLAYKNARNATQKADLFRLIYLYYCGGVYVDCDDKCLSSIRDLLHGRRLVLWQEQFGTIGNNFVAAAPKHPVVFDALSLARSAILRGDGESLWFSTGPGLMSRAVSKYLSSKVLADKKFSSDIRVLTPQELRKYSYVHCNLNYKNEGLHWSEGE